jgi:autotransporter-associated beta strand protein
MIANGGPGTAVDVGGIIRFFDDSTGGTARVKVFGNGNLDISYHNAPGVTVGSIEGNGAVFLGAFNLIVGSNNLSTTFSGVIQDGGGSGGTGGSVTKIGTGPLTLTTANTYTGGTTVNDGTLLVTNTGGSGTGSGAVQVNAGTLGGTGKIAGAVTVGTGSGPGAVLSPGVIDPGKRPGAIIINNLLTFNSDGTYKFELRTSNATADEVVAKGVTINSGALFSFIALGNDVLTPGTVFTVIDNAAATPIAGTFSNLADGAIFTVGGNTFQANYEGGTGNDLTLTVQ